jgi:hypothetical protein
VIYFNVLTIHSCGRYCPFIIYARGICPVHLAKLRLRIVTRYAENLDYSLKAGSAHWKAFPAGNSTESPKMNTMPQPRYSCNISAIMLHAFYRTYGHAMIVNIMGFRLVIVFIGQINTTPDYNLLITTTQRLVFTVAVFSAPIGNVFRQWTFFCVRTRVLAGCRPSHIKLQLF